MMLGTSDETYQSLLSLRTVRRFSDTPIDDEDLRRILEAGRWTGSAKNRQDWTLLVLTDRMRIEELIVCGDFTTPLQSATVVICPVRHPQGYPWDMGRVSQNMMLAAAALGVGSCPVTLHREECGRSVLGVPSDHDCQIVLAMGYPDEESEAAGRAENPLGGRKPFDEVVRFDRFSLNG